MKSVLTSSEKIIQLIEKVKKKSFPELSNTKVEVAFFESDFNFMESRPIIYSLFLPFSIRYKITINRKLFQLDMPLLAVEGVLAHELAHTAYYVTKGRVRTILAALIFLNNAKLVEFERRTDIDAIIRGYGEALKLYRKIAYKGLSLEQIAKKEERYFTAEEIDILVPAYKKYPQLKDMWLSRPPLNLAAINRDIASVERIAGNGTNPGEEKEGSSIT